MPLPEKLMEDLPDMSGSEVKAVIAIYSEGKPLTASDLIIIAGMSRSTAYRCMESKSVRQANKHVTRAKEDDSSVVSEQLREIAKRIDLNMGLSQ